MSNHTKFLDYVTFFSIIDFFEIFTSGRYQRDKKALKVLASNSKHFRIYSIFLMENWSPSDDILNTAFSLITSVSKNLWSWKFNGGFLLTQEIQK